MKDHTSPLPDLIIFNLASINSFIIRFGNKVVRDNGLSLEMDQMPVIMALYYTKAQSQQAIADALNRNKASIARSVSYLQKAGMVSITQNGGDKRKNILQLTFEGAAIAAKVEKHLYALEEELFSGFSPSEIRQLKKLLAKVIAVSQKV